MAARFLTLLLFDSAQVCSAAHSGNLALTPLFIRHRALLWFAVEMYMLFAFGREVERFIGRRAFICLYLLLLFAADRFSFLWGFRERAGIAGSAALHFGIFIAFATIYPNVELLLRIQAKWAALVLAGAYSLQLLAYHVWAEMAVLWISFARGISVHSRARCGTGVGVVGQSEDAGLVRNRSLLLCRRKMSGAWLSRTISTHPSIRFWTRSRNRESAV